MMSSALMIGLGWAVLSLPVVAAAVYRVKKGPDPWTVSDGVLAFVGLLWVALGPSLVVLFASVGSFSELQTTSTEPPPGLMAWMIGCSLIGSASAAGFAWLRAGSEGIGLRSLSLIWVAKSALISVPLFCFFWAVEAILEWANVVPQPQTISIAVSQMEAGLGLFGVMLIIIIGAPLFEEIVFRGFIQPAMVRSLGLTPGIALTAGIFAIIHGPNLHAVGPVFVLGLVLGWLRHRTGTVTAPMILHVVNNAGAMLLVRWLGI
jgi:membrane protease YdiL (CAAX protease family)